MSVHMFEANVVFWRTDVTLTCPFEGSFFKSDGTPVNATFMYEAKGSYYCQNLEEDKKKIYHFYVEGKGE